MRLIPAVDIRGGQSVRLLRGDYAAETIYGDPVAQAKAYADAGATLLHVVDLDAARSGEPANDAPIAAIAAALDIPIEVGGGIRSAARAEALLGLGAARIVIGTAALEDGALVAGLAARHPGRICVGLDYRPVPGAAALAGELAVRGWREASGVSVADALGRLSGLPLAGVVVTDISRDGTLEGPDVAAYGELLATCTHPLVASGGIGSLSDLERLAALAVEGRGLDGVIVGRALVSGAIELEEALAACGA